MVWFGRPLEPTLTLLQPGAAPCLNGETGHRVTRSSDTRLKLPSTPSIIDRGSVADETIAPTRVLEPAEALTFKL